MASPSSDRDAPTNLGPDTGGSGPNSRRDFPTNLGPAGASPSDPALRDAETRLGPSRSQSGGDLVGSLIRDRYRVVSELGRGGMGVVFEVEDTFAGGTFALKRLSAELSGRPEWVQSFVREATAAMGFAKDSPRFVTTYYVDRDSSGPFLVMERVGLPTLRTLLNQWASGERPGVPLLRALLHELALALSELHDNGFLHRDLKPENVFAERVGDGWRVKLADFGLSRETGDGTRTSVKGAATTAYGSPEQQNGLETSEASDVYSFGAVAYECFAGFPPVGNYERLTDEDATFPQDLSDLVDVCLSRRADRRPGLDSVLAVLRAEPSPSARVPTPGASDVAAPPRVGKGKGSVESRPPTSFPRPSAPPAMPSPAPSPRWQDRFPQLASYLAAMRAIPSGEFTMGSNRHNDEKPAHRVRLSGFRMGSTPATVGMWQEYCSATGASMPDAPRWGWLSDHPMVNVSWNDIVGWDGNGGFGAWASEVSGMNLTLPTEARWEYAARGGLDGQEYPWGDGFDNLKLWCSAKGWGDAGRTAPVVRTSRIHRNGYGLTDMVGNVWEWCLDWYGPYQPPLETRRVSSVESVPKPGLSGWLGGTEERTVVRDVSVPLLSTDPLGISNGDSRVLRGGSWYYNVPGYFRCADRDRDTPGYRSYDVGFRLVSPGP